MAETTLSVARTAVGANAGLLKTVITPGTHREQLGLVFEAGKGGLARGRPR